MPRQIVARYPYRDEEGRLLYQVVRFRPKGFAQRRRDPDTGAWTWKTKNVRRVVYRLPQLVGSLPEVPPERRVVYVAEGEKDVRTLEKRGLFATTNAGGAGKWDRALTQQLKAAGARRVVILPDNDAPGQAHAVQVARSCLGAGLPTKIVTLKGLKPSGDVSEWFTAGHTLSEFHHREIQTIPLAKGELPGEAFDSKFEYGNEVRPEYKFNPIRASKLAKLSQKPMKWVWERYLPEGTLALLSAYMKVGKTTFAYGLAISVSQGKPFLSYPTKQGGVLILAVEENRRDVLARLHKFGMKKEDDLYVHAGRVSPSPATIERIRRFVKKKGIVLVLVDTLARYWGIKDENNNSDVVKKVSPWLDLAHETGVAVLLIHHDRKSGGDEGRGIRGGSALLGLVDQALMLDRRPGSNKRQRILRALGRYDETPTEMVIELDGTAYRSLGTPEELDARADQRRVRKALSTTPQTVEALAETTKLPLSKVKRALKALHRHVTRTGKGVKGSPYAYARPSENSIPA
jgi:KaiC/GvpD/RAD55 family RecA-like ATPase